MSIQLQEVLKTDTLEIQRQKFNQVALDIYNTLAGGTNLLVGTIGIDDGTISDLGLYFNDETSLGFFRERDKKLTFVADQQKIFAVGDHQYDPLAVDGEGNPIPVDLSLNLYKNTNYWQEDSITSFTFSGGSGYVPGTYYSQSLELDTGAGGGAVINYTISGIQGSVTDFGNNYGSGTFKNVPIKNVSRPTDTYQISTVDQGSGNTQGSYQNVPTTGGSGVGLTVNISIDSEGSASSISISNSGYSYSVGDTISVITDSIGGGGSPEFIIDSLTPVASGGSFDITCSPLVLSVTSIGDGYLVGDYEDVPLTTVSGTGSLGEISFSVVPNIVFSGSLVGGSGYVNNTYSGVRLYGIPTQTYITKLVTRYSIKYVPSGVTVSIGDTIVESGTGNSALVSSIDSSSNTIYYIGSSGFVAGNTLTVGGSSAGTISQSEVQVSIFQFNNSDSTFDSSGLSPANTYRFDVSDSSMSGIDFAVKQKSDNELGSVPGVFITRYGTSGTPSSFVEVILNPSAVVNNYNFYNQATFDDEEDPSYGTLQYITNFPVVSGSSGQYGRNLFANISVNAGGAVSSVDVYEPGVDYSNGDFYSTPNGNLGGSGSGFSYEITSTSLDTVGKVSNVVVSNFGFGYRVEDIAEGITASVVSFNNSSTGGVGSGFSANVVTAPSLNVSVASNGSGYISGDVVTVDGNYLGGSFGNTFSYVLGTYGIVSNVELISGGSGYTNGTTLLFDSGDTNGFLLTVTGTDTIRSSIQTYDGGLLTNAGVHIGPDLSSVSSVSGLIVDFSSRFNAPLTSTSSIFSGSGSEISPSLSFSSNTESGFFIDTQYTIDSTNLNLEQNYPICLSTDGKKSIEFLKNSTSFRKAVQYKIFEISDFVVSSGNGYSQGRYRNVNVLGGSGSESVIDITIGFGGSITNGGSGYFYIDENGIELPVSGGSGTGAIALVKANSGIITSFEIVDPGDGNYLQFETVGIDVTSLKEYIVSQSGSGFQFTIGEVPIVSYVNFSRSGYNYNIGDVLVPDPEVISGGTGLSITVTNISEEKIGELPFGNIYNSNKSLNKIKGRYESRSFKAITDDGIFVGANDDIQITPSGIARLSSGNLEISSTTGVVEIGGTKAVVVPSGTTLQRDSTPSAGSIRFNLDSLAYEAYDGANWGSLGGTRDVDGNTYIIPETSPGANENVLYFYNDGQNTLNVNKNSIDINYIGNVNIYDYNNLIQWEPSISVTTGQFLYYGNNVYEVTADTITDSDFANAPIHTDGTVLSLLWIRDLFGSISVNARDIDLNVDGSLSINELEFSTVSGTLNAFSSTDLSLSSKTSTPLLTLGSNGSISVNVDFASVTPSTQNIEVLDYSLESLRLKNHSIRNQKITLTKGLVNTAVLDLYDPALSIGCKVTLFIVNSTTGEKQTLEYLVINDGSDIHTNEISDLYTGTSRIISTEIDFSPSNIVRVLITLGASLAASDVVYVVPLINTALL